MARIMIPASGGLDSTVMLHETLRDTQHDVVAVHYAEDYVSMEGTAVQRAAFNAVTSWLASNVRTFDIEIGETKYGLRSGLAFDPRAERELMPGGASKRKTYWYLCRHATHGHNAKRLAVDEVWAALTVDNVHHTHLDHWRSMGDAAYESWAGAIPFMTPWVEKRADGNVYGRGRLENLRRLDDALRPLVAVDSTTGEISRFNDEFWADFCAGKTEQAIDEIQARRERLGLYGRYFASATHETFSPGVAKTIPGGIEDWREWDRAGRPASDQQTP